MPEVEPPDKPQVFFNPACSKCRSLQEILEEKGIEADYVEYLDSPPTRADLDRLMALLGITDPREMMRPAEEAWSRLGLDNASASELLEAITREPVLLQRPILVHGDRAVIARPPDRVLELLASTQTG